MSIITIIYLAIALLVFVSTLYNMIFKEERLVDQINAAMILRNWRSSCLGYRRRGKANAVREIYGPPGI